VRIDDVLWQALQFGFLTLAAYRLWRLIGMDGITEPFREQMRHGAVPGKVMELIECPWCLGSWMSFGVFAVATAYASVWLPVAQALAAATLVGLIGSRVEE
jgi:hypothetical protein